MCYIYILLHERREQWSSPPRRFPPIKQNIPGHEHDRNLLGWNSAGLCMCVASWTSTMVNLQSVEGPSSPSVREPATRRSFASANTSDAFTFCSFSTYFSLRCPRGHQFVLRLLVQLEVEINPSRCLYSVELGQDAPPTPDPQSIRHRVIVGPYDGRTV